VRAAVCGEPVALSTTDIEALRLPTEAGVKVTVMVQLAPAASEVPQLLLSPKLLEFVPVTEMLVMARAAAPGFDKVMGSAVAAVPTSVPGKASGFGLSAACGVAAELPVPLTAMDWVTLAPFRLLSVSTTLPDKPPGAVGLKVTETSQLVPRANGVAEPQRLASELLTGKLIG
jgi:hypothetical protein